MHALWDIQWTDILYVTRDIPLGIHAKELIIADTLLLPRLLCLPHYIVVAK